MPAAASSAPRSCCCAGAEDRRIQDFFIEQAFPRREIVDRVLATVGGSDEGVTARELMAEVNLGRGRIDALLKVLDVEGAIARTGSRFVAAGGDWSYDGERYARVTALRRSEQEAMAAFGADGRCLMRALQEELDDPSPQDCGRCAVCAGARYGGPLDPELVRAAALLLRSKPVLLETKKMAPNEDGAMRKIPEDVRAEEGARWRGSATAAGTRSCAKAGGRARSPPSWWTLRPRSCARGRRRSPGSRRSRRRARARWCPSTRRGSPRRSACRSPTRSRGSRTGRRSARWRTRPSRRRTCAARSPSPATSRQGPCLLVDDIRFSGWTLAMVAGQLRRRGAPAVYPLALATAF